jgi:hypothetical protein
VELTAASQKNLLLRKHEAGHDPAHDFIASKEEERDQSDHAMP